MNTRAGAPPPSAPRAPGLPLNTVLMFPLPHPLKLWGLLESRGGSGFGEWNLDAHYAFSDGWSASLGIYSLFNTHANAAVFWYVNRLSGEPASGVADVHEHPLEPIMARFPLTKKF
jgi:hypothetical protein